MAQGLERWLLSCVVISLTTSCLGPDDIDRTQPDKVEKSIFQGEWFFRQTVIDMPATTEVTFIGEQGVTDRVVWDIQRDLILAYRAYPFIDGADHVTRPGTGAPLGTPVAAYRIENHFDIQREYNPRTGEQTNVIVENDYDRPWAEREWMRVDWSQNLVADFQFTVAGVKQQPVAYFVPEGQGAGVRDADAAKVTRDYIDVVNFLLAEPEIDEEWSWYFGFPFLKCWFSDAAHQDCLGAPIKVRSSFLRAAESDYVTQLYDDTRLARFGYFRNERFTYDADYGLTEGGRRLMANRYNVWTDAASCYDADAVSPYAACTKEQLRPIAFHLTEGFPTHLLSMAKSNIDEWDRVMREGVLAGTGWDAASLDDVDIVVFCPHNPVEKNDPDACGAAGTRPQVGDLRYNLYAYIPNELAGAPLGYGPSATDPLTGEVISGNAFYYGAAGRFVAARTRDILEIDLGLLDPAEFSSGGNAKAAVSAARARNARPGAQHSAAKLRADMSTREIKKHATKLRAMLADGLLHVDKRDAHRARLPFSSLDESLVTDEIQNALGAVSNGVDVNAPFGGFGDIDPAMLLDDRFFGLMREKRMRFLAPRGERAGGCIRRAADVFDDGLLALLDETKKRFYDVSVEPPVLRDGVTRDDVVNFVEAMTMGDTQLHELGHVFGLRHNFAASADALNYEPRFWELKGPGFLMKEGVDERPRPEWALDPLYEDGLREATEAGLRVHQLSSVMDYTSTYGTNIRLRSYDAAAVKYGYFDVVEIFESTDIDRERAKLLRTGELHYTYYPEVVSNAGSYQERTAAIAARRAVNFRMTDEGSATFDASMVEAPYRFCSDEYVDTSANCQVWDQGADSFERAKKTADDYRNYTLLDAYKRDRVGFGVDVWDYLVKIYVYRFTLMLNQYKNWVNDELIVRYGRSCIYYDGGVRVEGYEHGFDEACGLDGYAASIEALNLFAEVLATPDTGCYMRLAEGCYLVDPSNERGIDEATVTLVDVDATACDGLVVNNAPGQSPRRALKVDAQFPYTKFYGSDPSCAGVYDVRDQTGAVVSLAHLPIEFPEGRPSDTRYDRETYGYYFYDKPVVIGSWWDKWMAVKALGDPWTDFIGTDTTADVQSYLINYNSLFVGDVNNIVGGIANDNARVYGPVVENESVRMIPAVSLGGSISRSSTTATFIDPMPEYTFRLWAVFNAAYQGQFADDLEFSESLAVTPMHAVTDNHVPDDVRADPSRYAEVNDPITGLAWYALRQDRENDSGEPIYSVGYEFIREMKDRYYVGGRNGPGTTFVPGLYDWLPRGDVRILTIFHQTARLFGAADVWEGDFDLY